MSDSSGTSVDVGKVATPPAESDNARMATVTLLRRMASVGLSCYMLALWRSPEPTALFQYHPLTMTAAFVGALPEGVHTALMMKRARSMTQRQTLGRRHMALSLAMGILTLCGYVAIYVNKNQRHKSHLATWHGLIGAVCVLATLAQTFCGMIVYFRISTNGVLISRLRNAHKYLGLAVVALGCASMGLGMQSNFATGLLTSASMKTAFAVASFVFCASAYVAE
uniref:Cytochrome b561 domain-containing protein n=1 Tax=Neobodo designis TaxID=312471 RepID=A0A7S1MSP3_NEODS|eukprot:CAMPEP_0174851674 /NCGR_PEP_ID=MMETSP1114-20130205/23317_1 /TAXON_ID=312471 /ORGANISM="Neobodo designis, Strain CCAP 1951/1" /LENGTH=223 /DNA_ID=CAMNT_0016086223 /DNA_START=27 /DNA_END=698 /DNA_ORIENTATION=-